LTITDTRVSRRPASASEAARRERVARLLLSCPDRPGIVAAVSTFLSRRGANILQSDQHTTDPDGGAFFMRLEVELDEPGDEHAVEREFAAEVAEPLGMSFRFSLAERRKRMAVLVSRYDHCLAELLWRWRRGELYADIPLVISNHRELEREAARFDVRFEHIPVRRDAKGAAEAALLELLGGSYDLIVLARYMQILSPVFLNAVRTPIINIHHSFLPAFAGADPYKRAHERGVKIIGATAHYVTEELDAGPIIEQDVARVSHRETVGDLVRKGADLERSVLLRAVEWHLEDRVLTHGSRTVVFP
jgi:formyltetrahydrofolate deformylase